MLFYSASVGRTGTLRVLSCFTVPVWVVQTLKGIVLFYSAGVGRTGTYIALDYLTNEGEETESVDVFECVSNLRQQRIWMVQTEVR